MPRPGRVFVEGGVHHVDNRTGRGEHDFVKVPGTLFGVGSMSMQKEKHKSVPGTGTGVWKDLLDFSAPLSRPRSPRLLAAGGRGDQPSPAGGRKASDPAYRIGHGRRTRPRPQPLPPAGCHPRIRAPHVGARHRRRCCDLVLRFDFDGAWHRPARSQCARGRRTRLSRPHAPGWRGSWIFVLCSSIRLRAAGCAPTRVALEAGAVPDQGERTALGTGVALVPHVTGLLDRRRSGRSHPRCARPASRCSTASALMSSPRATGLTRTYK